MLRWNWLFLCCLPVVALPLQEDQPDTPPQSQSESHAWPSKPIMPGDTAPQQSHSGDVVAPRRTESFPGSNTPLDRLSISPVDPKRSRQRRIKGGQKRRNGQVDQSKTTFTQVRSRHTSQADLARITESDPVDQTKTGSSTSTDQPSIRDSLPGDSAKTGVNTPRSRIHTGFGSPIDRIGISRFPSKKG
ncbi:hypothetical protein AALO_G00011290 [Alosa alosa]|uniref:Uncharacterized protein n=1 Tax=Alosa alosa TaxID=278164 RepID=A0AAV6HI87_9TELE|nr:hypothetical protein AALO_G00011290 [Alosa alosa]